MMSSQKLAVLATLAMGCAGVLWLSWIDVLPGGWTLRGWVEPHAEREARARTEYERSRVDRFITDNPSTKPGAIFFGGSSTIERFPFEKFETGHLLNRGINDEPCEHFLARLGVSLPQVPLGGAVLYMASVDFRRLNDEPEQIQERVTRVFRHLRDRNANLPILLIGILPEKDMPSAMLQRLKETNNQLQETCARQKVNFVSSHRPPLADRSGNLSDEYSTDNWHLNPKGYGVLIHWILEEQPQWADRLRPIGR